MFNNVHANADLLSAMRQEAKAVVYLSLVGGYNS